LGDSVAGVGAQLSQGVGKAQIVTEPAAQSSPETAQTAALPPWTGRPIVLVGLMGAGKTTVGRRLAHRLNLPFLDADAEIEAAAGRTIEQLFADFGEPAFRDGERRVIARLLSGAPMVLATGGGAYIDAETRALIKQRGLSIWLRAELDVLMRRVGKRSNRPLLKQDDPRAVMTRLMEARYPIYGEADLIIDSREGPHEQIVRAIIQALPDLNSKFPPAQPAPQPAQPMAQSVERET
jgi:shikimate kinase